MKTSHTPGPWSICAADDDKEVAYTVFADSQLVNGRIEADSWDDHIAKAGLNHANYESNARLIAAAPNLLDAIERIAVMASRDGKDIYHDMRMIRMLAIKTALKVKGEAS